MGRLFAIVWQKSGELFGEGRLFSSLLAFWVARETGSVLCQIALWDGFVKGCLLFTQTIQT